MFSAKLERRRQFNRLAVLAAVATFAAGIGAWLGWSIPFFTVRRWLNRKTVLPPSSISQLSDTQPV